MNKSSASAARKTTLKVPKRSSESGTHSSPEQHLAVVQAVRSDAPATAAEQASAQVLVVDDSASVRAEVIKTLSAKVSCQYVEANNGLEAVQILMATGADLVVCDLNMPDMDGRKLVQFIRDNPKLKHVPVIVVSSESGVDNKVGLLKVGAADYVTKPFNAEELQARVQVHLELKLLRDRLKAKNAALKELSITDELTQVANRRSLMETLTSEISRTARYARPCSFLLIDVDHFKSVNDRYGHAAGDAALKHLAKVVAAHLREQDLLGRYGGEEFGVVLPETDRRGANVVAERLRVAIARNAVQHDDQEIPISASIGVASMLLGQAPCARTLIQRADTALYRAKENGRNRVECA